MKRLKFDVETRSRVDIGDCGLSVYARHPSTEVLVLRYWDADTMPAAEDVHQWLPGQLVPAIFFDPHVIFVAHNAAFEIFIHRYKLRPVYGFPAIAADRWECSAARAGFARLPQGLDPLSSKLDLGEFGKDGDGADNMRHLASPIGATRVGGVYVGGEFDADPARHARNSQYCARDVVAECRVCELTPELPAREQRLWLLNRKINDRGVPIDLELCRGAVAILDRFRDEGRRRLAKLTGDTITTAKQGKRLLKFAADRGVVLRNAEGKPSTDAGAVAAAVQQGVADETLSDVLTVWQQLSSTAVDKYRKAILQTDTDGRCREAFKYYGSGPGRFSSDGTQLQNFRRPRQEWPVESIDAIIAGDYGRVHELAGGDVFELLADHVRNIICAIPGRKLIVSDFAAIEPRVLRWLARDDDGLQTYLRADAGTGHEPYIVQACKIYGCQPTDIVIGKDERGDNIYAPGGKPKRQIGKMAELQLGYQSAYEKFMNAVFEKTGIVITEEFSREVVDTYRRNNYLIPELWRNLERAAIACMRTGKTVYCDRVKFHRWREWLLCTLPCGRDLYYFRPRIAPSKFDAPSVWYDSGRGHKNLYGGYLAENVDQGTSRDLLADAMFRQDAESLYLVMHCHDETVVETYEDDDRTESIVTAAMEAVAKWATGVPVRAETHACRRYTK